MGDNMSWFSDRSKTYTKKQLELNGLMQDDLQYRENHFESDEFQFIGYKGNLDLKIPSHELIDAGVIYGHQIIHKFGRAISPTNHEWSNV